MHIAMLAFSEEAYPGQGVYLSDALLLLEQRGIEEFEGQVIFVRPVAAMQDLSYFGWMPDGSIANGTRAFALSVLAMYSLVGRWVCNNQWSEGLHWVGDIPVAIGTLLSKIKCKYIRHDNLQNRVLSNLVESAVNSKTNRSIQDPLFLSQEMLRCKMADQNVKTVMALYKQRALTNPGLHLKESVQDATVR